MCRVAGHADAAFHGLTISIPHPSKSGTLRVASAAPRDRAIAGDAAAVQDALAAAPQPR